MKRQNFFWSSNGAPVAAILLAGAFAFTLPLAADEHPDNEPPPVIEVDTDSGPVSDDRDDVTVTITGSGSIVVGNEPAIHGLGANWTVDNSGLLQQTGEARATVHVLEGTFFNRIAEATDETEDEVPGRVIWESGDSLLIEADGEVRRFSSIYIESWTEDATNWGEVRLTGTHNVWLNGSDSALDFTAIHLGGRAEELEEGEEAPDDPRITFTNRGNISAIWSGTVEGDGTGNTIGITGIRLEELELLDNHDLIEAVFDGEMAAGAGNRLEVAGIRADEDGDIWNYADGVIRAEIAATGTGEGTELRAVGIRSDGALLLENEGKIEATIREGLTGDASVSEAVGIRADEGGWVRNTGEIAVTNETGGSATGIRLRLVEDEPLPEPDEEDENDIPPPSRSEVLNEGILSARTGENGIATGIWSDGNLTLTNRGEITVNGIPADSLPNETVEEENGDPLPPATVSIQSGTGVLVENGDGDLTNHDTIDVSGQGDVLQGVVFQDGGIVRNHGTISVLNQQEGGTATGVTIRRDSTLEEDDPAGRAEIDNTGRIEVNEGHLAVNLENGGSLRNAGTIVGNIFLGDGDATLIITPDHTIDGTVDVGGGNNILELGRDGTRTGEYDGEYNGFDELHVNAQATIWNLTGEQQYAGGTEVHAGVLNVLGPLTSNVLVHEGGVFLGAALGDEFGGSPLVSGDLDVSGVLAIGSIDDAGALSVPEESGPMVVDGNVTFRDGSEFNVMGGHSWLETTGSVAIEEGEDVGTTLVINVSELEWDDRFTILEAQGGLTGEFSSERTSGLRPFLLPLIEYGSDTISARVVADGDLLAAAASTRNQREMARVLANADPSARLQDGFGEFFTEANFGNYGRIADSMTGEIIASGAVAATSIGRGFRQTIFNTIHHRPETFPRFLTRPPGAPPEPEVPPATRAFWTRGIVISGDLEREQEGGSVDYRMAGILLGYDFVFTPTRRVGTAFGYGDARASRGSDRVDSDILQAMVYGTHHQGPLVYDAVIGYGMHDMSSQRLVFPAGERLSASYMGHELTAAIRATMPVELDGISLLPLAGLDYTHFRQDGFNENGDWALDGSSVQMNSLRASLGLRILMEHRTARTGYVAPELRMGFSHELLDRDASFSAALREDEARNSFTTRSAESRRNDFSIGAGVNVEPARWNNVSIFGDYDFHVPHIHVLSAGFRIGF